MQCERLQEILDGRRRVARLYMERLVCCPHVVLPTLGESDQLSWFVFVVKLTSEFEPGDRDAVIRGLRAEGVGSTNYFPPIHLQPYMRERFGFRAGDFPVCEYVAARTLALPFWGGLTAGQVDEVCAALERQCAGVLAARR